MTPSQNQAEALIREWGHAQGMILWEDMVEALRSQRHTVDERLVKALAVLGLD